MRFGKKSSGWKVAGRRLFGDAGEGDGAVATEERNALLDSPSLQHEMQVPPEEAYVAAIDPTQRLLTSLGRFQRHVAKAANGSAAGTWPDECINQLITGIEIAISQGWDDIREALTGAARVLQSYEDYHRADDSVPFLQDSYEILCLMVGDLIVDNTRSGVMKKWEARYEAELAALAREGLTLVADEEEASDGTDPEVPLDFAQAPPESVEAPEPLPEADAPLQETQDEAPIPEVEAPWEYSLEEEDDIPSEEYEEDPSPAAEASSTHSLDIDEYEEELATHVAGASLPRASGVGEDGAPLHDLNPFDDPPESADAQAEADRFSLSALPSLDDAIEDAEESLALDNEELLGLAGPEDQPQPEEEDVFSEAAAAEAAIEEVVEETHDAEETEAIAAPGLSLNADQEQQQMSWSTELPQDVPEETIVSEESLAPSPEPLDAATPPPAARPRTMDPELERLLATAQEAMARGAVSDAKVLALQLAAGMARLESDRADAELRGAESLLEANLAATEAAEMGVDEADAEVRSIEGRITDRESEFEAKRADCDNLRQQMGDVERTILELEEQIRKIQEQRDAEALRLSEMHTELDAALADEARMQSEIEDLAQSEAAARAALETARGEVAALKEARKLREAAIAAARRTLEGRRSSVADIENSISQSNPDGGTA